MLGVYRRSYSPTQDKKRRGEERRMGEGDVMCELSSCLAKASLLGATIIYSESPNGV